MSDGGLRQAIIAAFREFAAAPVADGAKSLLAALGYRSDRHIALTPNSSEQFLATYVTGRPFRSDHALVDHWTTIDPLFQLTAEDITRTAQTQLAFEAKGKWNHAIIESYLFFAIELKHETYTRTQLAELTREINRLFPMPVMLLIRHGRCLTVAVINRRLHKKDESRDVLEKVTLIKDINLTKPHRAHVEILADLALPSLAARHSVTNFVQLHEAWRKTLDSSELNKRFFQEVAYWYFWASRQVTFPKDAGPNKEVRNATSLIRLITRLIFCWFIKEKSLIPDDLFRQEKVRQLLNDLSPEESTYYKAILQNLFFATLNQEMDKREFRKRTKQPGGRDQHYLITNLYRYEALWRDADQALKLFSDIPFLNGGLFECLDKEIEEKGARRVIRIDGFSDHKDNDVSVPNLLFFGEEQEADLNEVYGTSGKRYKVRGLLHIFDRYKFTVHENTPIEEEVALDPELLGKVFENLLASYNPETQTTARKQTGSFYTPREVVNYMVDEALIAYLESRLTASDVNARLRHLLAYNDDLHQFSQDEAGRFIEAIDHLKILDPACGSGAFPMGILHKLVFILGKLDQGNERWKAKQIEKASEIPDITVREKVIADIEQAFGKNELDYGRKLYLIEHCLYGVDIQPIAVQIAKLRCFISLVVDQRVDSKADNLGIRPLPNLETQFVAANTLIGIDRPGQQLLRNPEIDRLEEELRRIRDQHFNARTPATKRKCREGDAALRRTISALLEADGFPHKTAEQLAGWDPYNQNASAAFFDPEWMFGARDGFDIAIGNPPYVRADEQSEWNHRQRRQILAGKQYETLWEKWDLFVPFIERAYKLLKPGGVTTLIVSDAFCHSKYAQKPQNWFLKNARVLRLDFCSDLQIFDAAVHNLIYLFQRSDGARNVPERRVHTEQFGNVTLLPSDEQIKLTYRAFFQEATGASFSVATIPLTAICYISYGIAASSDEKLYKGEFVTEDVVQDFEDPTHPKRYIEGKDIRQWLTPFHRFLEWGTKRAPHKFRRQTFIELHEAKEKLMTIVVTGGTPPVMFDDLQRFTTHTSCIFVPWHALHGVRNNSVKKAARYRGELPSRPDLPKREELEAASRRFAVKYLLGVMNSTAARDFLRANRRSNIHLYPDDWKRLPIPDVPPEKQKPIIILVERILAAKAKDPAADVSTLEAEIDQLVYALYGLTPEEIKIVEESASDASRGGSTARIPDKEEISSVVDTDE